VAEQRDDGKPGADIEPAGSSTPAAQPPAQSPAQPPAQPPIDPQELEQFRQFQQFQDYLKFTQTQQGNQPAPPQGAGQVQQYAGGQPPLPPGPPRELVPAERRRRPAPKWLTWLGKKVIAWVLAFVVLAVAGTWLYNHYFPNDAGKSSAQLAQEGGGTYHTNQILTTASPYESVRRVYDGIAQHGPGVKSMVDHVCGLFDDATQQQFAADLNYPSCPDAVAGLHNRLEQGPGKVDDYAESISKKSGWPPGPTVLVRSCDFTISGGPALGDFVVKQVEKGQWLISGHQPGPAACSSAPPTTR
jgi:hypothetical protein